MRKIGEERRSRTDWDLIRKRKLGFEMRKTKEKES